METKENLPSLPEPHGNDIIKKITKNTLHQKNEINLKKRERERKQATPGFVAHLAFILPPLPRPMAEEGGVPGALKLVGEAAIPSLLVLFALNLTFSFLSPFFSELFPWSLIMSFSSSSNLKLRVNCC
jgi:hypothetical protein